MTGETENVQKNLKEFYQNSSFYNKKISKTKDINFVYKPSTYLLSSIVKYQKKKLLLRWIQKAMIYFLYLF